MYRKYPLRADYIYHVYNRAIGGQELFCDKSDFSRFCELINYYRFKKPQLRFSFFKRLEIEKRKEYLDSLMKNEERLVEIYSFCLVPNHFHLVLKEAEEKGILTFMSNLQNSYARYFNTKRNRKGSLFQEMFKAIRVESDEQFIHLCRYVHLNPYSNMFLNKMNDLFSYQWSSFLDYILESNRFLFLNKEFLCSFFLNIDRLRSFTLNNADYQKRLKEIEYLLLG